MSSIVIKGNTSGQVEIAAPDVAGSTTLTLPTGTGTVITDTAPKAGNVIQVVSTAKTDTFSTTTTGSFFDITGMSVTITPTSSSSKILVLFDGNVSGNIGANGVMIRLLRDLTPISIGDVAGNRTRASIGTYNPDANWTLSCGINYLDSPATTSATTYKLQGWIGTGAFYLNRSQTEPDSTGVARTASNITLMEVAG